MKQFLEEEQKSRKELERVVRKLAKQKNDCAWDDAGHWAHPYNHPHPRCVSVWMAIYFCKHACGGTGEGSGVCVCVCLHLFSFLRLHISITQSRVGLASELLRFRCWSTTWRFDEICLPDPASLDETTNICSSARNKTGMFFQNILPLGDWHCEHSPAHGTMLDKGRTSSLLLPSL